MVKIVAIATIRNGLEIPYPFVEAFLTVYPVVDSYFINDGGSTDGTLEILKRLSDVYPKIEIFQIPDQVSNFWECIDRVLEFFFEIAGKCWLWHVQADEFWHEKDLPELVKCINRIDSEYNSIRQRRIDVSQLQHFCDCLLYTSPSPRDRG